jgi:hypothetical protein
MNILDQTDCMNLFSAYECQSKLEVDKFSARRLRLRIPFTPGPLLSRIFTHARAVFQPEPSLHILTGDFIVVGDLNGSITDLLRIFHHFGSPARTNYLFLGNLVNGAEFSIQVIVLVLISKLLWPTHVYVLRGCEEFIDCCESGGFHAELDLLYGAGTDLYRECLWVFAHLPFAAVINNYFFCVSGGIGPSVTELAHVGAIAQPIMSLPPTIALELCWSEPTNLLPMFLPASRGLGNLFGAEAVERFLRHCELGFLIRGHEVVPNGCELSLADQIMTVFSNSQGNAQAGVAVVKGTVVEPVRWPAYAPLKRTDVAFLTSTDSQHFVVQHKLSAAVGQLSAALESLPVCPGLRLTTSQTGMSRPTHTAGNARPKPVVLPPARKIFSPTVKRITFEFPDGSPGAKREIPLDRAFNRRPLSRYNRTRDHYEICDA